MLKRININGRAIPVPVPIADLKQACQWVETYMVPAGKSVTSVVLDGIDRLEDWSGGKAKTLSLSLNSNLEIRIESAMDLGLQTVEAIHNLSSVLVRSLKPLAVTIWQLRPVDECEEFASALEDLALIADLIDHLCGLLPDQKTHLDMTNSIKVALQKCLSALYPASQKRDWRSCAQLLLRDTSASKGVESLLTELVEESQSVQLRLLSTKADNLVNKEPGATRSAL